MAWVYFWRINSAIYVKSIMPYNYFPADRPYMEVLPFIEANTPPGDIIGMTGGGNTGYFIHDRTIVNMDGLINSYDYFHALQNREAPDLFVTTWHDGSSLPTRDCFRFPHTTVSSRHISKTTANTAEKNSCIFSKSQNIRRCLTLAHFSLNQTFDHILV